jgi:hypothetical protein
MPVILLIAALVVFILALFIHVSFSLIALGLAVLTGAFIADRIWPGHRTP